MTGTSVPRYQNQPTGKKENRLNPQMQTPVKTKKTAPEAKVRDVLAYAAGRAPWAVVGYTKELAEQFNKNTQQFCRAVETKRRELASPQGGA